MLKLIYQKQYIKRQRACHERGGLRMKKEKVKLAVPMVIIWCAAILLFMVMQNGEDFFAANPKLFDYVTWTTEYQDNILYKIFWIIGDWTECQAYKSLPGALALLISGFIFYGIMRNGKKHKMFPVLGPINLFPGMVLAGFTGVIVSNILFGWQLQFGWIPTFLACASIPGAVVITYGGHWKVWLTAGILGGVIQYPLSYLSLQIANKISMTPLVVFTIIAVGLGGALITEIIRLLPWMKDVIKDESARGIVPVETLEIPQPEASISWYLRRMMADFTELLFFGNEWVGLIYILALVLSWAMNPAHIAYGIPYLFPAMIAGQFMASSLSIVLWYGTYKKRGGFNTYCANEAMAVVPVFFGTIGVTAFTNIWFIVAMAVISAVLCPWIVDKVGGLLAKLTSKRYEGAVAGVTSAAPALGISIGVVTLLCKGLLMTGLF